jgi:hypothetical protein
MYGAQDERYAGDIAVYYDEEQEEYDTASGNKKIQSCVEKDDGT